MQLSLIVRNYILCKINFLEILALHHNNFSLPLYVFFVVTFNVNDPDDEDDEEEVALSLTLTSSNASPQNLSGVESKQLYV